MVRFEIIGSDAERLRGYYADLFGAVHDREHLDGRETGVGDSSGDFARTLRALAIDHEAPAGCSLASMEMSGEGEAAATSTGPPPA